MKILAICADIYPGKLGGAEVHFVEVLKRIAPKLETAIVFVGPNPPHFPKFPDNVTFKTVPYPHIPNLYGILYILFATPVAIITALKLKPNLIWAKQEFPQAQVGALVKLFTGKPLYITSQNPLLGEEELVGKGGDIATFLVSLAFRVADTVAAVSSYSADQARKLGAKHVVVIPNGVDLAKFS